MRRSCGSGVHPGIALSESLTPVEETHMLLTYIILGLIGAGAIMILRNARADPRNRAKR